MVAVHIYIKPTCPYCIRAKQLLQQKGVTFTETDVNQHPDVYTSLKQQTGHQTVPLIFISQQFIGGCDQLYALERNGQLDKLLSTPSSYQ